MLEVFHIDEKWYWQWICSKGKVLYKGQHHYRTQLAAVTAAKEFRMNFMGLAAEIDHRQGACL